MGPLERERAGGHDGGMRSRPLGLLSAAVLLVAGLGAAPAGAAEPMFPPGNSGFHTYNEMAAEVAATAQAHPGIVERFSIGRSHQKREIWAVKVSDNVAVDEREPEVLFDGLHHADEHMSQEMTLAILTLARDRLRHATPTITRLVDSREIWIVFALNPDGATYDIGGRVVPPLAQEPPGDAGVVGDRDRPQPQLRLPLGLLRRCEHDALPTRATAGRARSRRPRRGPSATSSTAASSAAASRSVPRSASTRPAGS